MKIKRSAKMTHQVKETTDLRSKLLNQLKFQPLLDWA